MMMHRRKIYLLLIGLMLVSLACVLQVQSQTELEQTLTPLSAAVEQTVTARAGDEGGSGDDLATAIVKATQRAQEIYVTQTARAVLNEPSRLATATAIAPVVAELPRYGIDPASGYVAWIHNPVTIDLNGYQQTGYANDYQQTTAADFVMAADITWNTKNSLSGCGFMFRSDGDTNKPSQYVTLIARVANGRLAFMATVKGEAANLHSYYPRDEDKSFAWENDKTNRLAVVARGNLIDVYTNGVLIGQIDTTLPPPDMQLPAKPQLPPGADEQQIQSYQTQLDDYNQLVEQMTGQLASVRANYAKTKAIFTDGFLGFVGLSQSGRMICTFSDAWLFIIGR